MKNNLLILLAVVLSLLSAGCQAEIAGNTETQTPVPSLQLSYKADTESLSSFSADDLGNAFSGTLEYVQVTDVMINTEDAAVPLEDALRDGIITFHEIQYLAQKDAEAGICYETVKSKRGLSRFSYDYISYKLVITNDIYETPDGKQHHIQDITVTRTGLDPMLLLQHLDQEDWGIEFEVADVNPAGITLNYTQSGGQLIGQLCTGNYELSRTDIVKAVQRLDAMLIPESQWIEHNSQGTITLDFETLFGSLDRGDYLLYLYLHDDYDPEQAPPLVRNYHDMQCYGIEFSIP